MHLVFLGECGHIPKFACIYQKDITELISFVITACINDYKHKGESNFFNLLKLTLLRQKLKLVAFHLQC